MTTNCLKKLLINDPEFSLFLQIKGGLTENVVTVCKIVERAFKNNIH